MLLKICEIPSFAALFKAGVKLVVKAFYTAFQALKVLEYFIILAFY